MWKVLILAALAAPLHALTEQEQASLQVKAELVKNLNAVGEGDFSRKILIGTMIRKLDASSSFSPAQADILQQIHDMLGDILLEFRQETVNHNSIVQDFSDHMRHCDVINAGALAQQHGEADTLQESHNDCRDDHVSAYDAKMTKHLQLETYQNENHKVLCTETINGITYTENWDLSTSCKTPVPNEENIRNGLWQLHLACTLQWFQERVQQWVPLATHYLQLSGWEENNRTDCKTKQVNFEAKACAHQTLWTQTCAFRTACWDGQQNNQSFGLLQKYRDFNTLHPNLVKLIKYIRCLLLEMIANRSDVARDNCAMIMSENTDPTAMGYDVYYIDVPYSWPNRSDCAAEKETQLSDYFPLQHHYEQDINVTGTTGMGGTGVEIVLTTEILDSISTCATP